LRALYQRRKGRDLFDLAAALRGLKVSSERIVNAFKKYCENGGQNIPQNYIGIICSTSLITPDSFPIVVLCYAQALNLTRTLTSNLLTMN